MNKTRSQLPPMTALPVFEASARLLSFTRAAEELHVTQAAISRQIRVLEENLGVSLFDRSHRKIKLTNEGQSFQHVVAVALGLVANSANELRGQITSNDLTIAADISMAHLWLLPRFPAFREEFSNIAVSILASERESDCLRDGVDLALLYGDGNWSGYDSRLLVEEEIFPVCSPDYLNTRPPITKLEDLVDAVLLDLRGDRWDWVDWQQWFAEKQVDAPDCSTLLAFNNLPLLIQAACRGQGIGLGWRGLVDELLEDGTLVKPLDISLKTGRGYYVIKRADIRMSAETRTLLDWVIRMSSDNGIKQASDV
ncbi:LysR substrate-binding domain-containing protein [Pelagibius sp. Alg239-R121]|uniref:LysR substrate-binding domain-containing protein n=1 Tax=Pelagibius sp. Alg239-R121 TaxID=2993448 RepID=UPI0024A6D060|nr:LysR substrate-binding domain-containing protein [Pelagibius sp. Alg239-R121]